MAVPASYPLEIASSIINFGAWRSWQRGCFGSIRSQIRFLPPRPHKSETGRCRSFSRGNRTQELGVAGTRNRTPLEHWPRGPRQRHAKPWPRKRPVRSNRTCSAGFFITYSDPLTQRPECLPVQEEAKGSTPLRIATHHAEIAQTVSASVADSISALGTIITSVRLAPHPPISSTHFPPALAQRIRALAYEAGGCTFESCARGQTPGVRAAWVTALDCKSGVLDIRGSKPWRSTIVTCGPGRAVRLRPSTVFIFFSSVAQLVDAPHC